MGEGLQDGVLVVVLHTVAEMQEEGHNHVVAHVEVVALDVEDPGVVGHLLVGKMLDSHEEQVVLEVDLHVLGDLHVLVVDLLDLPSVQVVGL